MTDDFETLAREYIKQHADWPSLLCDGCHTQADFGGAALAPELPDYWRWLDLRCHGSRSAMIVCPSCAYSTESASRARNTLQPVDTYFGACPECGRHDGYVNLGSTHVFVCREHKTGWMIGSNLFSSWKDETPEQQEETRRMLTDYRHVEPIHPPPSAIVASEIHQRMPGGDDDIPF